MKASQYNYGFCNKGKFYLFNGMTYKFIEFDISLKPCVEELLRMPNEDWGEMYSFKLQLYNAGFLIDDDVNELERLFGEIVKNRSVASYSLMILPTYDCNFSCWYCIQSHKHEYMSGDIVESKQSNGSPPNQCISNDLIRTLLKYQIMQLIFVRHMGLIFIIALLQMDIC